MTLFPTLNKQWRRCRDAGGACVVRVRAAEIKSVRNMGESVVVEGRQGNLKLSYPASLTCSVCGDYVYVQVYV